MSFGYSPPADSKPARSQAAALGAYDEHIPAPPGGTLRMAVQIAVSELPELGLEQHEYIDPAHYALELDRFWRPGWRFVCHESEIAARGQYVRYDLAGDSVIVIRGH